MSIEALAHNKAFARGRQSVIDILWWPSKALIEEFCCANSYDYTQPYLDDFERQEQHERAVRVMVALAAAISAPRGAGRPMTDTSPEAFSRNIVLAAPEETGDE